MDKVVINDGINPEFAYEVSPSADGELYSPFFHFWFGSHLYIVNPSTAADLCIQYRSNYIILIAKYGRGTLSIFLKDAACGIDLSEGAENYRVYMNQQQMSEFIACLRQFVHQSV